MGQLTVGRRQIETLEFADGSTQNLTNLNEQVRLSRKVESCRSNSDWSRIWRSGSDRVL